MKSFVTSDPGRIVVLHLGKGDLLLESIENECRRLRIRNGVVLSCIGSMRKAVFHVIMGTDDDPVNEFITLEKPMEIGAVQGIILDGVPHLHIACSDPQRVYTGHLEPGTEIQYLCEISILELGGLNLMRRRDEFGIDYIDYK